MKKEEEKGERKKEIKGTCIRSNTIKIRPFPWHQSKKKSLEEKEGNSQTKLL